MTFSLLQFLEGNSHRRVQLAIAVVSAVGTFIVWWIHLTYPGTFPDPFIGDQVNRARLIFVLAPPFLTVFCLGTAVVRRFPAIETSRPMMGHLRQRESERKWKIS